MTIELQSVAAEPVFRAFYGDAECLERRFISLCTCQQVSHAVVRHINPQRLISQFFLASYVVQCFLRAVLVVAAVVVDIDCS